MAYALKEIVLRPADAAEAGALTELALRSKGYWGYDQAFLEACRDELTLHPAELEARRVVVADSGGKPVGFYSLEGQPPEGELGYLFVEPFAIGRGIGGQLWNHMRDTAGRLGFRQIRIGADPDATPFYRSRGADLVGAVASGSIPGRELPLLRYVLSEHLPPGDQASSQPRCRELPLRAGEPHSPFRNREIP